jgi:hypothetical protein
MLFDKKLDYGKRLASISFLSLSYCYRLRIINIDTTPGAGSYKGQVSVYRAGFRGNSKFRRKSLVVPQEIVEKLHDKFLNTAKNFKYSGNCAGCKKTLLHSFLRAEVR